MRAATSHDFASAAVGHGESGAAEAVSAAIAGLEGRPSLVLAFLSGKQDADASAREIEDCAAGAPAAGMTGVDVFGSEGSFDHGAAAIAFGSELEISAACQGHAGSDLRLAGAAVARRALEALRGDPGLLVLLVNPQSGDVAETIAGAYAVAGPRIRLAGGGAGGDRPVTFWDGRASEDSVVAIAIAARSEIGLGVAQSCRTRGQVSLVTRSAGQRLIELDGLPAEEVYMEAIGISGLIISEEEFRSLALAYPIAQLELHADPRLRHVTARCDDGSILTSSKIPVGAPVEFVELHEEQLLASARESVGDALARLPSAVARAALVFDCAGRRRAMEVGPAAEVDALLDAFGPSSPSICGIHTCGEIARIKGARGERNHAVVTVAFA